MLSLSLCNSSYSFPSDSQDARLQVLGICYSTQEISFGRLPLLEEAYVLLTSIFVCSYRAKVYIALWAMYISMKFKYALLYS